MPAPPHPGRWPARARRWYRTSAFAFAFGGVVLASGACTTSERAGRPAASGDSAALETADPSRGSSAGPAATPGQPACLMEGDWTPCAVEERLVRAGVVIEKQADSVLFPFLGVAGVTYNIGNAEHELLVFLYPSAAAREHDTARLDPASVSPPGERVAWRTPPTLVVSNNLAAVILSLNDRTVERLTLALGAGLPAPEKR